MRKTDALADHDQLLDCPHAKWSKIDTDRADYGIAGFDACASVEKYSGIRHYAWSYFVSCAVKHSEVQGRFNDPDTCFEETARWLRELDCPGKLTERDKTWKQWAMIGQ